MGEQGFEPTSANTSTNNNNNNNTKFKATREFWVFSYNPVSGALNAPKIKEETEQADIGNKIETFDDITLYLGDKLIHILIEACILLI